MTKEPRIIQIIPGNGWVAVFSGDAGEILDPVVCFALVEVKDKGETTTEVRPMTVDERLLTFCDDVQNFVRVQRNEASK